MQQPYRHDHHTVYLDVSQFILKEHSPQYKPITTDNHLVIHLTQKHLQQSSIAIKQDQWMMVGCWLVLHHTPKLTPDISPIDNDTTVLSMSPFFASQNNVDMLMNQQQFSLQKSQRQVKKSRPRSNTFYLLYPPETELDKIIEEAVNEINDDSLDESYTPKVQPSTPKIPQIISHKDIELEKLSTQSQTQTYQALTYKVQLIQSIQQITKLIHQELPHEVKLNKIKDNISKYLFDYQLIIIDLIQSQYPNVLDQIINVLQNLLEKKIGLLSFQSRRAKLLKYLEKKKRKIWNKKVSYDCRKKVADGRLRIKGKFVTREQVFQQLGLQNLQSINEVGLKALLQNTK